MNLLLKRFVISLPFLALSAFLFIPLRLLSLFSPLPLVVVGILLVDPLSLLLADPSGSLFSPRGKRKQAALMFSVPEARIMDGMYGDALILYREMLQIDPQRLEIYIRIMDLAFRHMKEPDVARDTLSERLKAIRELREREILSREYSRLRAVYREAEKVLNSESSVNAHPRDEESAYDPHCL